MEWKCPKCGVQNEDSSAECSCGYSFFKILGIRPGASAEEAKQAYQYLLTVWQKDRSGQDALSKKKAEDRLKKINEAYEIFRKSNPGVPEAQKKGSVVKIAASAGAVLILFIVLALSTNLFKTDKTIQSSQDRKTDVPPAPSAEKPAGVVPGVPSNETASPSGQPSPGASIGENDGLTDEKAVEMVKKSRAIFGNFSTEAIIKKWTEENSSRYQMVGWKAKKMDEGNYLVSYTAMDGTDVKGFYFNLDIKTGNVENLEKNPELQKKYNIRYGQGSGKEG